MAFGSIRKSLGILENHTYGLMKCTHFPGAYGFPLDCCIQAFFDALLIHMTHVDKSPHLQEIQLVCFDSDSAGAAIMILQSLLEVDRKQSEAAAMDR